MNSAPCAGIPPWNWEAARVTCLREAQRVLRDRDAAEDAAQEAVVRAWKARDNCRDVRTANGWLRAIAANEARRVGAQRARGRQLESLDGWDVIDPRTSPTEERLGDLAVVQLLSVLPARDRRLMQLRYLAGLSHPEIARSLDIPEGTVKTRLHRTRCLLRTLLTNEALG
jgi:RNA polymerase sigma-70 factor (ECF subfamily)